VHLRCLTNFEVFKLMLSMRKKLSACKKIIDVELSVRFTFFSVKKFICTAYSFPFTICIPIKGNIGNNIFPNKIKKFCQYRRFIFPD